MLFDNLISPRSEFQKVGIATEKARVPASGFTLGTDSKWKPDERNLLGWVLNKAWQIDTKFFPKKELDTQWYIN